MIIEQPLKDKMEQALQNAPDLAIDVPLKCNEIHQVLFGITKAEHLIRVETEMLQRLNEIHNQLIQALNDGETIDQQTLDHSVQAKAEIEQLIEQLTAQTTSNQNEEE